MIAIAGERLGSSATTFIGDMRDLSRIPSESSAAVLSFFAVHHIDQRDVLIACREWYRVLHPEGQLLLATWEGSGPIDYGEETDVVALRYTPDQAAGWVSQVGFSVDRCVVEPVEEIGMDAIYLEASKHGLYLSASE
jgi:ubiquinone/menaquinone biosynthesis C-methylase UbiE